MAIIVSRYSGQCKSCTGKIAIGEKIVWLKYRGARHMECAMRDKRERLARETGADSDELGAEYMARQSRRESRRQDALEKHARLVYETDRDYEMDVSDESRDMEF